MTAAVPLGIRCSPQVQEDEINAVVENSVPQRRPERGATLEHRPRRARHDEIQRRRDDESNRRRPYRRHGLVADPDRQECASPNEAHACQRGIRAKVPRLLPIRRSSLRPVSGPGTEL